MEKLAWGLTFGRLTVITYFGMQTTPAHNVTRTGSKLGKCCQSLHRILHAEMKYSLTLWVLVRAQALP